MKNIFQIPKNWVKAVVLFYIFEDFINVCLNKINWILLFASAFSLI